MRALDGISGQSVFDDHAVFENDFAIGARSYFRIVRDQHEGRAGVAVALEEQIKHKTSVGGVEVAGGFIGHDDGRIDDKSAGQRDTLLFASGELNWIVIHAFAQADSLEQRSRSLQTAAFDVEFERKQVHFRARSKSKGAVVLALGLADQARVGERGLAVSCPRMGRTSTRGAGHMTSNRPGSSCWRWSTTWPPMTTCGPSGCPEGADAWR